MISVLISDRSGIISLRVQTNHQSQTHLSVWLAGWLACWLAGWLAAWLAGCLAGCLAGWQAGRGSGTHRELQRRRAEAGGAKHIIYMYNSIIVDYASV